jgi:hypothetical protein
MRPCPGQLLGAHAFASGACVACGEHPPDSAVAERDRIVAWLRDTLRRRAQTELKYPVARTISDVCRELASAIERGDHTSLSPSGGDDT